VLVLHGLPDGHRPNGFLNNAQATIKKYFFYIVAGVVINGKGWMLLEGMPT
jgi:hypothetical protein